MNTKEKIKKEYGSVNDTRKWVEVDSGSYGTQDVLVRVTFTTQHDHLMDFLNGVDTNYVLDDMEADYTKIEVFE